MISSKVSVNHSMRKSYGTAGPAARHVLPAVVDWLFRRDRFGARDRVARGGLFRLVRLSGPRPGRCAPDDSTISRTRRLIDLETHRAVFTWVLQCLSTAGLVKGKTIGSQTDRPTPSVATDEQINCVSLKTPLAPRAAEHSQTKPHFTSYTVFPPTTVRKTFVANSFSGDAAVTSRSSTIKSASIPGTSLPFSFSSNSAKADPVVYAAIA